MTDGHALSANDNFITTVYRLVWFLADRTNGRAYATLLRPSVCRRRL